MSDGCVQLAIEQVNANEMELLQGSRLTYLLNNTEGTSEGLAVAQWLMQQNVVALYSGTHSIQMAQHVSASMRTNGLTTVTVLMTGLNDEITAAVAAVAQAQNVLQISCCSSSDTLSEKMNFPLFGRVRGTCTAASG